MIIQLYQHTKTKWVLTLNNLERRAIVLVDMFWQINKLCSLPSPFSNAEVFDL